MPRARCTVSIAVIFIIVAHFYDTSYSREYGKRADKRPDLLDVDDTPRIRACLGGDASGRQHAHARRAGDAQSSGARGLDGDGAAAINGIAERSGIYRMG